MSRNVTSEKVVDQATLVLLSVLCLKTLIIVSGLMLVTQSMSIVISLLYNCLFKFLTVSQFKRHSSVNTTRKTYVLVSFSKLHDNRPCVKQLGAQLM